MRFELAKFNLEEIAEVFKDTKGISFAVGNANFYGVTSITAESGHNFDADPDPEAGYDGGGEDYIDIKFSFEGGGNASVSFCPEKEHCEVAKELNDLWIFRIESIPDYVAREKELLDYRLREYEAYTKK